MKRQFNYIGKALLTLSAAFLLLVSCQDTDYPNPQPATSSSTNQARFLFVNVAPGVPSLNFFVENNQAGQALQFGQNSSGYTAVQAGTVQLRGRAASGQIGGTLGSNDILYRAGATNQNNFAANAGASYTVFVTDTLNTPAPTTANATNPGGPQFLVVTDTLTAPAAGNARIRVFNFAPDVPATSVRLLNPSTNQGAAVFPNRVYRNVAGTNLRYTSVPAGTYTAQVYTATAAPASTTAPTAATSTVTLADGKIYTLYVSGLNRSKTLGLGVVQHN
jgi:hypothetical protein